MKNTALVRRQLMYGFNTTKDTTGRPLGASVVKLAKRNAFELIGLRRPKAPAGLTLHWRAS